MKLIMLMVVCVFMLSVVGCGKTVAQLREDGGAIVDNGGSLIKKIFDAAVEVYNIGKKVVEDSKDNVSAVKGAVVGPATPAKP